jgi:hypothetical protein
MDYVRTRNLVVLVALAVMTLALGLWLGYRWWAAREWGGDGYRSRDY